MRSENRCFPAAWCPPGQPRPGSATSVMVPEWLVNHHLRRAQPGKVEAASRGQEAPCPAGSSGAPPAQAEVECSPSTRSRLVHLPWGLNQWRGCRRTKPETQPLFPAQGSARPRRQRLGGGGQGLACLRPAIPQRPVELRVLEARPPFLPHAGMDLGPPPGLCPCPCPPAPRVYRQAPGGGFFRPVHLILSTPKTS